MKALGLCSIILLSLATGLLAADAPPTFERDIRPIFAKRCTVCHQTKELDNPDVSGGLALDSFDSTLRGTNKHKIIIAGKATESPLFSRLNDTDEDVRMPLSDSPLKPAQRELIKRWIDAGTPRGTADLTSTTTSSTAAQSPRKIVRSLDLACSLPAVAPRSGTLEFRLKIGPLPAITSLAFSNDGQTLAVGSYGQITFWNLADWTVTRIIDDIPGALQSIVYSPDGKTLAAGAGLPARTGVVLLYDAGTGKQIGELTGHRDVVARVAFRPDGKQLVSASYDTSLRFWNLENRTLSGVFKGHSDFIYDVAYLPDGKAVLSASKDRSIKRVDTSSFKEKMTYGEHDDDVLALAVRPDGKEFVTSGNEPAIRSWLVDADKSSRRTGGHGGPVNQLCYSRDGKKLVSASGDKSIRLFDGTTTAAKSTLQGPTDWQYAVAINFDGKRVAAGGGDGVVRVWDAEASKVEAILLQPPAQSPGTPSWISVRPEGSVNATPDLLALIRWVVAGKESPKLPALPAPSANPKTSTKSK